MGGESHPAFPPGMARAILLSAHLLGAGGVPIGSARFAGPASREAPLSPLVDLLSDFMNRATFASDDSAPLALDHGDVRILALHGSHCLLVVFLRGREGETLRECMATLLTRFEARYTPALAHPPWNPTLRADAAAALRRLDRLVRFF